MPHAVDLVIVVASQVSHSLQAYVRGRADRLGLPVVFTSHKFTQFPASLAKWGIVPIADEPAAPVQAPIPEAEQLGPLVPLSAMVAEARAPERVPEPPRMIGLAVHPLKKRPRVWASTQLKRDFALQALSAAPTLTNEQLRQMVREKFGHGMSDATIAEIWKELADAATPHAPAVAPQQAARAVDTTVSGGDMAMAKRAVRAAGIEERNEYAKELLDGSPAMAGAVVIYLVREKFGAGVDQRFIREYRLKKHGLRGAPAGRMYDKAGTRRPDMEKAWADSLKKHPGAREFQNKYVPPERKATTKLAAVAAPGRASEKLALDTTPRDQMQGAIAKVRALMAKLNIDQMVIPLEGKVQARQQIIRDIEF